MTAPDYLRRVRGAAARLVAADVPPHRWAQRAWALSVLRDLLQAEPLDQTESLDAAWAEVEAALPEGWGFALAWTNRYRADAWEPKATSDEAITVRADGPTPAAALLALAARLRETG